MSILDEIFFVYLSVNYPICRLVCFFLSFWRNEGKVCSGCLYEDLQALWKKVPGHFTGHHFLPNDIVKSNWNFYHVPWEVNGSPPKKSWNSSFDRCVRMEDLQNHPVEGGCWTHHSTTGLSILYPPHGGSDSSYEALIPCSLTPKLTGTIIILPYCLFCILTRLPSRTV